MHQIGFEKSQIVASNCLQFLLLNSLESSKFNSRQNCSSLVNFYQLAGHRGPVGQYLPVDSEVGGSNLGNGKSLFLLMRNVQNGAEERRDKNWLYCIINEKYRS